MATECSIYGVDANHQLTEPIIHKLRLPEKIGDKWKDLARSLGYSESIIDAIETEKSNIPKECCIKVLVCWIKREAEEATVERLAQVLTEIELRNLARILKDHALGCKEEVAGSDNKGQFQFEKLQKKIIEMQADVKQLKEEDLLSRARIKELEGKLLMAKQENQHLKRECQEVQERNSELVNELQDAKQKTQAVSSEQDHETDLDSPRQHRSENTRDQAATEREIIAYLRRLSEQLHNSVISPLQVSEVKEDKLKTPVMVDLLTRLSVTLQELYSRTLYKATESCKCSEEVKREFYEFAYHGLRAEHNDLVHRVKELTLVEEEMTGEEKSELLKLKQLQINRQRQVDKLEKLWRGLFSPPESHSKTCSEPFAASGCSADSREDLVRHCSCPSEQNTSTATFTTSVDEKDQFCIKNPFKGTKLRNPFKRRQSNKNSCCLVSYSANDPRAFV